MTTPTPSPTEPSPSPGMPGEGVKSSTRIFVLLFVAIHLLGAVGIGWLMPGGFPVDHPKFWANRVLPPAVVAYAIAVLVLAVRRRWAVVAMGLLLSPIAWIGAAVGGIAIFPVSGRIPAVAVMVVAVTVLVAVRRHFARFWPGRRLLAVAAIAPLLLGGLFPLTQQGAGPATLPVADVRRVPTTRPMDTYLPARRLGGVASVTPSNGEVMTQHAGRIIQVQPLLTFISRSPDRCWTNLAPRQLREGRPRRLCTAEGDNQYATLTYLDDGWSQLVVTRDGETRVDMHAISVLPREVYSHLNTFAEIGIAGHRKLSLVFSPAPQSPIEVTYGQYPVGRPTRQAYLGGDGVFRIVEATSGEKGPYHELASGPLKRDDPLTITLLDEGTPFARVTMDDFARQASTQLSPTAGWGLPVNAIEFRLEAPGDRAMASLFVTLASTSVGRGWDSVGHAAGSYRNRMTVEYLDDANR